VFRRTRSALRSVCLRVLVSFGTGRFFRQISWRLRFQTADCLLRSSADHQQWARFFLVREIIGNGNFVSVAHVGTFADRRLAVHRGLLVHDWENGRRGAPRLWRRRFVSLMSQGAAEGD